MIDWVIPVRDREPERIKLCIRGLANPKTRNIIVVDYGSTAYPCNTSIFGEQKGRILYIPLNKCPIWNKAHALNIGIKRTVAEYIGVIDCDTILSPDFIDSSISHLSYNKFIYTINVRRVRIDYATLDKTIYTNWDYSAFNYLHSFSYDWSEKPNYIGCVGGVQIYPRAWVFWVGGFDENLTYWGGVDTEMFLKAKLFLEGIDMPNAILHQEHPFNKEEHLESESEREYAKGLRLKRPREVREKIARGDIRQKTWGQI